MTAEFPVIEDAAIESAVAPISISPTELGDGQLQRIIEGALLAAGKPLTVDDIAALFDDSERPTNTVVRAALAAIAEQCSGRGFELREVASGFRFQVVQEVAPWIARLWEEKPQRYSRALLETLALIAYRQPITRGDIEDIRGVAVASNIIKTLLEHDWVRVVGHKDVPGRPALFATTRKFLDYFNLKNLDDLPTLAEIRDLDSFNAELALEGIDTVIVAEQEDAMAPETESAASANVGEESLESDQLITVVDSVSDPILDTAAAVDTNEAIDTSIFSERADSDVAP
jgi:segregation and condensation protein B